MKLLSSKEKKKYSVITPVYNSYSLMEKYFESFLEQKYTNFELILIDDSSTDDSYEKLKKYASTSTLNIKIFQTEKNSGPGLARNIGIEKATGEWITFVDNDDWVTEDFFDAIEQVVNTNKYKSIIFNYNVVKKNRILKVKSLYYGEEGQLDFEDCIRSVRNHTVCKVYNRNSLIKNDIKFPNIRRCEDVAFVLPALSSCEPVYYLDMSLYNYLQRDTSLSNQSTFGDDNNMEYAFNILENKFLDKYKQQMLDKSITDLLYGSVLMKCKNKCSRKVIVDFLVRYEKKYPEWYYSTIISELPIFKRLYLQQIKSKNVLGLRLLTYIHSKVIGL